MAILLKIFSLDIIAEGETAVKAEGKMIAEHVFPEGAVEWSVPDIDDVLILQVSKYPRPDLFLPATDMATVTVPKKITGMDISFPGNKCAVALNKLTLSVVAGGCYRKSKVNPFFLCSLQCLLKNLFHAPEPFLIPQEKPLQVEGNAREFASSFIRSTKLQIFCSSGVFENFIKISK